MTRLEPSPAAQRPAPSLPPGRMSGFIPGAGGRAPAPRGRRGGRKVFGASLAHLLLMAGVIVFLFPFVWMISTSLKTDEELTSSDALPQVPVFQPHSPYVKDTPAPARPIDVPPADWHRMLPALLERAEAAIADAQRRGADALAGEKIDHARHREAAARVMVDRAVTKLNRALWTGPRADFDRAFGALLTPEAAADALDESLARLELLQVTLRTLDARIHPLTSSGNIAAAFRVESGPGTLRDTGQSALLSYDFPTPEAPPVILDYDFDFPAGTTPADLHKLIVSIRADNSWHRIDATLDMGGQRWRSERTVYIAQHRPMSLTFQPPTFDDETVRARTWIPLRREEPGDREQETAEADREPAQSESQTPESAMQRSHARLRLILSPSSTVRANFGKFERNYERAFYAVPFWKYVFNSVLLVVLTTLGALFSASFVAYAFARLNWPGRSAAFLLLLSTMMLPGQVTMIPSFMIWREVGWYNTLNPLWVPAFFGGAFFIFLMVQHMKTIPRELEEAARLDGLNALQSWYYIILPQVKPTLAAIAILSFMGAWNEFMGPLIYLRDQAKFPLSLGLFGMRVDQGADWTMMMAGNVLMTLPVIVIFFIFQRYFIQGMTLSGIKG